MLRIYVFPPALPLTIPSPFYFLFSIFVSLFLFVWFFFVWFFVLFCFFSLVRAPIPNFRELNEDGELWLVYEGLKETNRLINHVFPEICAEGQG